jgi:phosphatidylinositol-3,4,5-trisphosphate 3-phosphatase/dual-specificity protein phosphatase PTEN
MKALRAAVSGSRVRFTQDGFDLDLTYITPKLIAMGYPASGVENLP